MAGSASDLSMAEVLAALSLATDLGNGFPMEKALRNTLVAVRLAERAGLGGQLLADAFYVAMLRYIGCTALDYEMGANYGDAIAARNLFASLDMGQPRRALPQVVRHLGQGEGPRRRAAIVGHFLRGGKREGDRIVSVDCEVVARMASRLRLGSGVVSALGQMFERWDGKGVPSRLAGDGLEPVARVVHVAHAAEIHHRLSGVDGGCRFLKSGAGGWFDPQMVSVFMAHAPELVAPLGGESVWEAALAVEPAPRRRLPADRLDELTAAFADFVDLKSPWMLGHSRGWPIWLPGRRRPCTCPPMRSRRSATPGGSTTSAGLACPTACGTSHHRSPRRTGSGYGCIPTTPNGYLPARRRWPRSVGWPGCTTSASTTAATTGAWAAASSPWRPVWWPPPTASRR